MTHILYSAVKALIKREGKYLILRATYWEEKIQYYDLPWGRIEEKENPFDALKREVKEETNLDIQIEKSLGIWWFDRIDNARVICHTFLCNETSWQLDILSNPSKNEDIIGYTWMTKEELLESSLFQDISIKDIFLKL